MHWGSRKVGSATIAVTGKPNTAFVNPPHDTRVASFMETMRTRTAAAPSLSESRIGRQPCLEPPMHLFFDGEVDLVTVDGDGDLDMSGHKIVSLNGSTLHSAAHKAFRLNDLDLMCTALAVMLKNGSSMRPIINQGVLVPCFEDCASALPYIEQLLTAFKDLTTNTEETDVQAAAKLVVFAFSMTARTRVHPMIQFVSLLKAKSAKVALITGPLSGVIEEFEDALIAKDAMRACVAMQIVRLKHESDASPLWGCTRSSNGIPAVLWETLSTVASAVSNSKKKMHPKVAKARTVANKMSGSTWTLVMVNLIMVLCKDDAAAREDLQIQNIRLPDDLIVGVANHIKALAATDLSGVPIPNTVWDKHCAMGSKRDIVHFVKYASYMVGETTTPEQEKIVAEAEKMYTEDMKMSTRAYVRRLVQVINMYAKKNMKMKAKVVSEEEASAPSKVPEKMKAKVVSEEEASAPSKAPEKMKAKVVSEEEASAPSKVPEKTTVKDDAVPKKTVKKRSTSQDDKPKAKRARARSPSPPKSLTPPTDASPPVVNITPPGAVQVTPPGDVPTYAQLMSRGEPVRLASRCGTKPWTDLVAQTDSFTGERQGWIARKGPLNQEPTIQLGFNALMHKAVEAKITNVFVPKMVARRVDNQWMLMTQLTADPAKEPVMMVHKKTSTVIVNVTKFGLPILRTALVAGMGKMMKEEDFTRIAQQLLAARTIGIADVHVHNMAFDMRHGPIAFDQMVQRDDTIGVETKDQSQSIMQVFMSRVFCREYLEDKFNSLAAPLVMWMDTWMRFLEKEKESINMWSELDWETINRRGQTIIARLKASEA